MTRTSSSKHSSVSEMYANQLVRVVNQMLCLLLHHMLGHSPTHDGVLLLDLENVYVYVVTWSRCEGLCCRRGPSNRTTLISYECHVTDGDQGKQPARDE